jgi:hypothetical protein
MSSAMNRKIVAGIIAGVAVSAPRTAWASGLSLKTVDKAQTVNTVQPNVFSDVTVPESSSTTLATTTSTTAPAKPSQPVTPAASAGPVIVVRSSDELTAALAAAKPGDTISLADGTYSGTFTAANAATAKAPIVLRGSRKAVLDGGSISTGFTLHLDGADYWHVEGFSITGGQKGIVAEGTNHAVISGLDVANTGLEGINLRKFSSDNVVQGNRVHNTGLKTPDYGEGIYIGSSISNWNSYTGGKPDNSDRNQVLNNTIFNTTAESIDIKEGTSNGVLRGNTMDAAGMSGKNYADSWIDMQGNNYTVSGNTGKVSGSSALVDGIQVHVDVSGATGWGRSNTISANTLNVDASGYGVTVDKQNGSSNRVGCDNRVAGAGKGPTNQPCN